LVIVLKILPMKRFASFLKTHIVIVRSNHNRNLKKNFVLFTLFYRLVHIRVVESVFRFLMLFVFFSFWCWLISDNNGQFDNSVRNGTAECERGKAECVYNHSHRSIRQTSKTSLTQIWHCHNKSTLWIELTH
jgi:hypothetical protein